MSTTHQVYQANVVGESEPIVFCIHKQRLPILKEEIERGRRLIVADSLVLLHDNLDRNTALNLTKWQEF